MTKKSVLEEALDYLINDEHEKAVESLHNFIVRKAKEVHESLREEDELDEEVTDEDEIDESKDEDELEEGFGNEYFGSSDLAVEADDDFGGEEVDGEVDDFGGEEVGGEFGDDEVVGDEMGGEMSVDGEPVTIGAEQKNELQMALDALTAKFAEIVGDVPVDDGMGDDMVGGEPHAEPDVDDFGGAPDGDADDIGDEETEEGYMYEGEEGDEDKDDEIEEAVSHDMGLLKGSNFKTDNKGKHGEKTTVLHNNDAKLPESADFDFDLTEEDFMDLEEGLKSIDVKMGGEQGGVKYAGEETNTKSPVANRDKSDIKANSKSMVSKKSEHSGYNRETAPTSGKLPHSGDNSHDSMNKTGSPTRKEVKGAGGLDAQKGHKTEEQGGVKFAGTETNVKSPIGSAGTRNESGKSKK